MRNTPHAVKDEQNELPSITTNIPNGIHPKLLECPILMPIGGIQKHEIEIDKVDSIPRKESFTKSIEISNSDTSLSDKDEKWQSIAWQVFIPFTIAGFGTIGAGLVLGYVESYEVFKNVKAIYILVPAIIGLKGNLDMCLASRLCTQAHLGNMATVRETMKMIIGNIALVQIQAIIAATLVSVFAVSVSALLINGNFVWEHAILLATCSILTATMSCFFLDIILIGIIFVTFRVNLNPDNLATPFAASIGDVVSLAILSSWAKLLYIYIETHSCVMVLLLAVFLFIILPFWVIIVRKNTYTKEVLRTGWIPVLGALLISGMGGLVLDSAVGKFKGFVVFQPMINGIGGNLVSVQASRISTMLHKSSIRGVIPPHTKQWVWPWTALIKGVMPARSARVLLLLSIPGQVIFVVLADIFYNKGILCLNAAFVITYLVVSFLQLVILLYVCHILVHLLWRFKIDPDSSAIPFLTALGDVLGSSLLLIAFIFLDNVRQEYKPISP